MRSRRASTAAQCSNPVRRKQYSLAQKIKIHFFFQIKFASISACVLDLGLINKFETLTLHLKKKKKPSK